MNEFEQQNPNGVQPNPVEPTVSSEPEPAPQPIEPAVSAVPDAAPAPAQEPTPEPTPEPIPEPASAPQAQEIPPAQTAPEPQPTAPNYGAPYGFSGTNPPPFANTPPVPPDASFHPIEYSPVTPVKDYRPASKGLRVFCIALAALILLTGTTLTGYLFGKHGASVSSNRDKLYSDVELDLAAKPKDTDEYTAGQVYEMLNQSVVGISVYNSQGTITNATGVVYTEDGYILTNDHIYSTVAAPKFRIYLYDGTEYSAEYVAGDVISDLAVLKITDGSGFKPAVFGDSKELFCGETVVALGRPSGASDATSITKGTVSMTSRRVSVTSSYSARMIQTDSAINPGSSGGVLANMYGQVVGITSSKQSGTAYDAIGFAIPTDTVQRVVTQLISDGKVTDRAKLGITYQELDSVKAEISGAPGVGIYVASVSSDSDLYNKVAAGDIITKINGIAITGDDIVLDIIEESRAGDTITVTVMDQNGNISEYTAKLSANIGESSYKAELEEESQNSSSSSSGGTFDFPFGE